MKETRIILEHKITCCGECCDKSEYEAFTNCYDLRVKTWLVYQHAAKLSGFKPA